MILIWLDDIRDPMKDDWLVFSPIARMDISRVVWLKSYQEFVKWIGFHGIPDAVCFDHDLSDFQAMKTGYPDLMDCPWPEQEKTGYDAAIFLAEYCQTHNKKLPAFNVHSSNPAGAENILSYLNNYRKHVEGGSNE